MEETINGIKTIWNSPRETTLNNIKQILIQILKERRTPKCHKQNINQNNSLEAES